MGFNCVDLNFVIGNCNSFLDDCFWCVSATESTSSS